MNGKGGTGKTTIAALMTAHLVSARAGSVLAIDADPNSCFAPALGERDPQTIVGVCDEVSRRLDSIPAGMTKERFIEMRVQESVAELDGLDLMVMGRPEGPGCYCYVNNLLRDLIGRLADSYDYVVIDNAAGMEHISRRTMGQISKLVLVSDYSAAGVRSTKRIFDLAAQMKIGVGSAWMIVNRVTGPVSGLSEEIGKTGLRVAGEMPYSEALVKWNLSDSSVFGLDEPSVSDRMADIMKRMMG